MLFSMTKALNGQNSLKQNSPPPTFQSCLENLVCLNACFRLFSNPFSILNFIRTTSLKLRLQNLNIGGDSEYIRKRLDIPFQLFYFGLFIKIFRLLRKSAKPIWKLFFPKCLVLIGKGYTSEKRKNIFHVWVYFIIHFTLCLIFLRVCPKDDPPFEIIQITRIVCYICCSAYKFIKKFIELSTVVISRIYQAIYAYIYICIYIYVYTYILGVILGIGGLGALFRPACHTFLKPFFSLFFFLFHSVLRYFRWFPHPHAILYCPNPTNQPFLVKTNIKRTILPDQLSLSIKNQFLIF